MRSKAAAVMAHDRRTLGLDRIVAIASADNVPRRLSPLHAAVRARYTLADAALEAP